MQERRSDYEFSNEDKRYVRQRANGKCEFPGSPCEKKVVRNVAHITGASIAMHEGLEPASISDPDLNAIMLCKEHLNDLDMQEAEQMTFMQIHEQIPFVSLEEIRKKMQLFA